MNQLSLFGNDKSNNNVCTFPDANASDLNILLVNVDCNWNLALRRIYAYYENANNNVSMIDLNFGFYEHKKSYICDGSKYDFVAVSNIFETNANKVSVINCNNVIFGGIGSKNDMLNLPPEIEATEPKYFDGEDTAHGYITRGCIRNCYFCKVPKHEGNIKHYRDVSKVVGNFKKAVFMDNNILAWGGANDAFQWLIDHKIKCEFNQGLDIRLVNDENLSLLSKLNYIGEYVFAFDDWKYIKVIEQKLLLVKKYISKPWKLKFFVYISPEMPLSDTVNRIKYLKQNECLPYIMRDQKCYTSEHTEFYTDLAAWCNQPGLFKKLTFDMFLSKRHPNNIQRQAVSLAKWRGEEPNNCESCWKPAIDLYKKNDTYMCIECFEN